MDIGEAIAVGIEDCNELFFCIVEHSLQGASLESISTLSVQDFYLEMFFLIFLDEKLKWRNNEFSRICLYLSNTNDNETAYTTHNDDGSHYIRYDAGFLHKLYS